MMIKVKFKDNEEMILQAYQINITEEHVILTEEKNRFWTTLKLSEIEKYQIK